MTDQNKNLPPIEADKADDLLGFAASLDRAAEVLAPTYEDMREQLLDIQFGRHVEIVTEREQDELEQAHRDHETRQREADHAMLTGFIEVLPAAKQVYERAHDGFRTSDGFRKFQAESLYQAKLFQTMAVWSKPEVVLNSSNYSETGRPTKYPLFPLGVGKQLFRPPGSNKEYVRVLMATAVEEKGNEERRHPQLVTTFMDPEEWSTLTKLQSSWINESFSPEQVEAMSVMTDETEQYLFPAQRASGPPFIQFVKHRVRRTNPKKHGVAKIDLEEKFQVMHPRWFDLEDWEGIEASLSKLAVAFGKTNELKEVVRKRAEAITPDPLTEYLDLEKVE